MWIKDCNGDLINAFYIERIYKVEHRGRVLITAALSSGNRSTIADCESIDVAIEFRDKLLRDFNENRGRPIRE